MALFSGAMRLVGGVLLILLKSTILPRPTQDEWRASSTDSVLWLTQRDPSGMIELNIVGLPQRQ